MAKVMVVDDNEEIARLVSLILSRDGHEVEIALSGDEALKKLERFSPDLILMDYFMPGKDGAQVSKEIHSRERFRNVPIILFTIMSLDEGLEEAVREAEAVDYIRKPFSVDVMTEKVRRVLRAAEA